MKLQGEISFKLMPLAIAVLIGGCAGKFTLIDRSDGQIYKGSTDGPTMGGSGNATLLIEGESYSGPWIYQASGGSFNFTNFASTSSASGSATTVGSKGGLATTTLNGTGTSSGSTTTLATSAVGNGMINARAASGKFVRCVFSFNTMSNTGIGECLRNDGRTYDLNVKR
ncbi:MAG TPA: hypothetical protein VL550_04910 [Rhodocyclaceae bacterium]|jgi:hypothetical protein|nr:hypothetical protein [Rhodocyclaceae bacterium]